MKRMMRFCAERTIALFLTMILSAIGVNAQQASPDKQISDSIKSSYLEELALKNPMLRQIQFSSELIPNRKVNTRLSDNELISGNVQIIRSSFSLRVPIVTWKENTLSTTMAVLNQRLNLENVTSNSQQIQINDPIISKTTFNLSANFTKRSKLFDKPVVYNAMVTSLFNPDFSKSIVSFSGIMLLNLKHNKTTNLSIGGAVLISPSTQVPAFLLLSYEHKFENSGIELIANLPYRFALRKPLGERSSLSFVNELSGTLAFYDISDKFFPQYSRYQTSEIRSGFTLEHRLGRKMVLGFSTGALYTLTSELKKESTHWDDSYILKNGKTLDPFFNLSFSVLPF